MNHALVHSQPYDVYVILTLPTSQHNHDIGNFMVNLTLFGGKIEAPLSLKSSSRVSRLTYKSPMIDTMDTLLRSPLYLSGLRREQEALNVLMMEGESFRFRQSLQKQDSLS